MPKEITIRLSGQDGYVGVALLIETLENTLKLLRDLERAATAGGEEIRWEVIRASMQSPLELTIAPKKSRAAVMRSAERVVKQYTGGFRLLSREPTAPPEFDEATLRAVEKMVEGIGKENAKLSISAPDEEPVEISPAVAENVKRAVEKAERVGTLYEVGTIEGMLEEISTHGRDNFTIWEVLTNHRVECAVANAEQFENAKQWLRGRVAVSGRIKYKNRKPVTIAVEQMRLMKLRTALPQPSDIGKVDITGGISSEEYVRRLRNGK